jgi:hypothetical protein
MKVSAFERFAGLCAILAAVSGLLYSVAFVIIARSAPALAGLLTALFLMAGGLLSVPALLGLYLRLRAAEGGFALLALGLGLVGALGAAIHGGYDLANAINAPVINAASEANLPNQVDPRGLLTFGVAGLSVLVFGWLMGQGAGFSRSLGLLGYALGVLLVVIYLGRLIVLQPTNPVLLIPALLVGFILNPVWYVWLGLSLLRGAEAAQAAPASTVRARG